MDQEYVADVLRETLVQIRKVAIGVWSSDINQNGILSLIRIPHKDSERVQSSTAEEMSEFYFGQILDIAAYCEAVEPSPFTLYVAQLIAKVQNWDERGIIDDMPPLHAPQKSEESVIANPAKTYGAELRNWRISCFEDIGFTLKEAERLADAITIDIIKDGKTGEPKRYESPLHQGKVKKMLEAGANHKQIVNLLT